TESRFKRRQGVDAKTYFDGSWSVFLGEKVEVSIMFTGTAAKLIDSSSHHPNETKKSYKDGRVKYSVTTRGIEEIRRWILSYGNEAEVIKPLSLRNELCQLGRQLSAKYKN
ncbi:MAG: WYL domain-containing protein, partial [candidate division Zixibacteria bacterium]|nr:WYL domain-containing protein [candidate division Zixibacteria bacterium]